MKGLIQDGLRQGDQPFSYVISHIPLRTSHIAVGIGGMSGTVKKTPPTSVPGGFFLGLNAKMLLLEYRIGYPGDYLRKDDNQEERDHHGRDVFHRFFRHTFYRYLGDIAQDEQTDPKGRCNNSDH